jgi:hypothetical protein
MEIEFKVITVNSIANFGPVEVSRGAFMAAGLVAIECGVPYTDEKRCFKASPGVKLQLKPFIMHISGHPEALGDFDETEAKKTTRNYLCLNCRKQCVI